MTTSASTLIATAVVAASSAASILFARRGSDRVSSEDPFSGEPSSQPLDRALLAFTLLGLGLHALIARELFEICSNLYYSIADDVVAFWFQGGPALAIWCAACLAGRWKLQRGLTNDGRAVWFTLVCIGVCGWVFSALAVLSSDFRGWNHGMTN